ncbi:hypothetical protein HDV03_000508 [Kappamyces sp. JEL0829]|nr:hypothetical protein HDV03_000508 [Kappamyces sp. JEL0829]
MQKPGPPTIAAMTKGHRFSYNAKEKLDIIAFALANTQAEASLRYGVHKSMVSRWVRDHHKIQAADKSSRRISYRRPATARRPARGSARASGAGYESDEAVECKSDSDDSSSSGSDTAPTSPVQTAHRRLRFDTPALLSRPKSILESYLVGRTDTGEPSSSGSRLSFLPTHQSKTERIDTFEGGSPPGRKSPRLNQKAVSKFLKSHPEFSPSTKMASTSRFVYVKRQPEFTLPIRKMFF